jgi:hypothetical protein
MKMSDTESKGGTAPGERMPSPTEIDMEMDEDDQETYVDTSEEDVEEDEEEVDLEDEHTSKLLEQERRDTLHKLHQSSLLKNNKTEKKLSFSVASLLGQKDEKDSDDSNADKNSLRYLFHYFTLNFLPQSFTLTVHPSFNSVIHRINEIVLVTVRKHSYSLKSG